MVEKEETIFRVVICFAFVVVVVVDVYSGVILGDFGVIVRDLGIYIWSCVVFGACMCGFGSCDVFDESFGVYEGGYRVSGAVVSEFCNCVFMDGGLLVWSGFGVRYGFNPCVIGLRFFGYVHGVLRVAIPTANHVYMAVFVLNLFLSTSFP